MTIVECFEKSPFENMISTLTVKPDKLIFIGVENQMQDSVLLYKNFLKSKGIKTKVSTRGVDRNNLENIISVITDIIKNEKDCVFDIGGGEDTVILALGIVFERYKDKYPFKIQKINIPAGKIVDCDCDNEVVFTKAFSLTVKELISLHSGIISDEADCNHCSIKSVDKLWDISRKSPKDWNKVISTLNEFEKFNSRYDKINVVLDMNHLKSAVVDFSSKSVTYHNFVNLLISKGLIKDYHKHGSIVSYKYKSESVRSALNKAGNILEMKVAMEAKKLEENGKPFFDSCHMSVTIDWDCSAKEKTNMVDTKNEVDVILMKGLTPVFISCKNGNINDAEPYKLNTVAARFGGCYAKKVIIASDFERSSQKSEDAFFRRMKDMDIIFVPNVDSFTQSQWQEFFLELCSEITI
ncbi:MAG: DUF1887 family protein [Ruminococcus sp.]|nr:DUF1887 family protein [Ruminococcus sp.]